MKNFDDLDSYRKETEKIIKKHGQLRIKSSKLHKEVSSSMSSKKERFEEKRKQRSKETKFLRNK